jgi:hypothetical protein
MDPRQQVVLEAILVDPGISKYTHSYRCGTNSRGGFYHTVRSDRKKAEEERERLILKLRDALSKVRTLSGMLPICASCKKIRNDKGYWEQIETYLRDHSEAEFTHGICPDCAKKLYPEFHAKK